MAYVKLFSTILDSTVWETDPATRVTWITMLAMADRDGLVEASVPGLARRAGVSRPECERALALFMAPDPDSRTKEHDGRRVEEIDGGWRLLNYEKYRDKATASEAKAKAAARQKRYRDRLKASRGDVTRDGHDEESRPSREVTDSAAQASSAAASTPEPTQAPLRPSWVCVVRIFEETHPWVAGLLDASRQKPHAESIWRRLGEDESRVKAACEAHANDDWARKEKAAISHLAAKLEKYADNGTAASESKADEIARLRRERSGWEVGANLGEPEAVRAVKRIDALIAEVSA